MEHSNLNRAIRAAILRRTGPTVISGGTGSATPADVADLLLAAGYRGRVTVVHPGGIERLTVATLSGRTWPPGEWAMIVDPGAAAKKKAG